MFDEGTRELLKKYITQDDIFGPKDAADVTNPNIADLLFESHNEIYTALQKRPAIIIGRKGAGKTSFLQCITSNNEYDIVVELVAWEALEAIINTIERLSKGVVFVESVAKLWESVFWSALITKLVALPQIKDHEETIKLKGFLYEIGVSSDMDPDTVMTTVIDKILEYYEQANLGTIRDTLKKMKFNGLSLTDSIKTSKKILKAQRLRAVILMDSIEEYQLDVNEVVHAVSGLLKCLGSFHIPGDRQGIRCCLPAEIYHLLQRISSQPLKDFKSHVTLHWHAGELLKIASSRLRLYYMLYEEDHYNKVTHFDFSNREHCSEFFEHIFPTTMTNRFGTIENPIAYILRHTQLNPRQLIHLLNNIFYQNRLNGDPPTKVSADAIKDGILHAEESIVGEVFSAYRSVHPEAEKTCRRAIPELPRVFDNGKLHKIYNRYGKKYFHKDFDDFRRMLIEISAIGRVIRETDRYIVALFEYTQPHQLTISTHEQMCLHPLYTEIFNNRILNDDSMSKKPIYPYGTDVDGVDYRDFTHGKRF